MHPIHNHAGSRRRRISVAVMAGLLLVYLASAVAEAQTYEVTTDGAALREGPSRKKKIIRTMVKGERVQKLAVERGYFKVRTERDALEGYIGPSLLAEAEGVQTETPDYNQFIADLLEQQADQKADRPGVYPYEAPLDFLRDHNHQVYAILWLLAVAIAAGAAGVVILIKISPKLDQVLPPHLAGLQRTTVKTVAIVTGAYAVARAAAYFLDLALHLSALEDNTILVMVLIVPRLLIAAPLTVLDALGANWAVGVAVLIVLALIAWPRGASGVWREAPGPDEMSFLDRPPTGAGQAVPTRTSPRPSAPAQDSAETGGDTRIIAGDEDEGRGRQ